MPLTSQIVSLSFDQFLHGMANAEFIAVDTETNGLDPRDGRGFAWGCSVAYMDSFGSVISEYFPFRHGDNGDLDIVDKTRILKAIEDHENLIFHNAKFDLEVLRTEGCNPQGTFFDTIILAHLIDENVYSHKLDYLTKKWCGLDGKKQSPEYSGWIKAYGYGVAMPSWMMHDYAANDADITLRLFYECKKRIDTKEPELWGVWEYKMRVTRLLIKMERRGVMIDVDKCQLMTLIGEEQMVEITDILGLNPGSTKDQYELFVERLGLPKVFKKRKNGTETISFDKDTMELYDQILDRRDDTTAQMVSTYRGWQKSVSSNYKPYVERLSPDGRLRCSYKMHGTKTGRLSCEKPNLQQIPRKGEKQWNGQLKACFIEDPGYTLWEADYSQLELRLATAYASEEGLKEVFNQDRDIFTEMAAELQMARFDVKTLTYTIQYGGGINRISHVFNVSSERASEIRENFWRRYPGFKEVSTRAQNKAKSKGTLDIWTGRKRHFQWPKTEAHKAFNSVIQGGAADVVERAMLRLEEEVDCDDCRMLLQVHDSVVFRIKDGSEDKFLPEIQRVMEDIPEPWGVKFAVDVHKWGE